MSADETAFRGGFRFVPVDGDRIDVDVWGVDLTEVLPRTAEAVSRAAGEMTTGAAGETMTLDVGSDTEEALVASVVVNALATLDEDRFYVEAATCRALATADAESGFDVRFAARIVCRGVRLDEPASDGLQRLADHEDPDVTLWRENDLVRVRFHLLRADGPESA